MAYKSKKPCKHGRCPNLTTGRYCEEHEKLHMRPSAHQRGYSWKWNVERKKFLEAHPKCVNCDEKAVIVDHIIPHKGNDRLFWEKTNWQAYCKKCHDIKTATEDGGFGNKVKVG